MNVAELTLEYDGKAWHAICRTTAVGHWLGVRPHRAVRVVVGPTKGHLDVASAIDLREDLLDLVVDLVSHLAADIIDRAGGDDPALFNPVPEGPMAP